MGSIYHSDITSWIERFNRIAGIISADGKVLGLMPHPERAMEFVNLYD